MKTCNKVFNWVFNEQTQDDSFYELFCVTDNWPVARLYKGHNKQYYIVEYSLDSDFSSSFTRDEDGVHHDGPYTEIIYTTDIDDAKDKAESYAFRKYCEKEIDIERYRIRVAQEKIKIIEKYVDLSWLQELEVGDSVHLNLYELYNSFNSLNFCRIEDSKDYIISLYDKESGELVCDSDHDDYYVKEIFNDSILFKNEMYSDVRYFRLTFEEVSCCLE